MVVKSGADANQFVQKIKFGDKIAELYYRVPQVLVSDKATARKLFERDNPGMNLNALRAA